MTVIIASTPVSNKVNSNQERLEAIFHTVDTIKSDLNKFGMRLQKGSMVVVLKNLFILLTKHHL